MLLPWPVALDEIIEVGAADGLLLQGEVFVRPPVIDPETVRPRFGAALPFLEEDLSARRPGLRVFAARTRYADLGQGFTIFTPAFAKWVSLRVTSASP